VASEESGWSVVCGMQGIAGILWFSIMYFEILAALVYWGFRLPGTSEARVGFPVPGQARRTSIVVGKRVAYAE
jgi:hypothetical protein